MLAQTKKRSGRAHIGTTELVRRECSTSASSLARKSTENRPGLGEQIGASATKLAASKSVLCQKCRPSSATRAQSATEIITTITTGYRMMGPNRPKTLYSVATRASKIQL